MAIKLSKRLQTVADMVDPGVFLADIGSDHAALPIRLVQSGKVPYAMAVENKVGPFVRMKANIDASGLGNQIKAVNADGISRISDGVNCLTICGMGGLLTCEILEAHPEKLVNVRSIILDPHTDLRAVRERVTALGYHIQNEKMVYEDRVYYSIIKFCRGLPKSPYSQADLLFGPINRKMHDQVYVEWISLQRKKVSDILNKGLSPQARERYLSLYRLLAAELKAAESEE